MENKEPDIPDEDNFNLTWREVHDAAVKILERPEYEGENGDICICFFATLKNDLEAMYNHPEEYVHEDDEQPAGPRLLKP
jgi:hypothetical protein